MSSVDVINNALSLVGAEPIVSLNDASASARIAGIYYETTLSDMLAQHPFSFSIRVSGFLATPTEVEPYPDFMAVRAKPSDMLSLVRLVDSNGYPVDCRMMRDAIAIKEDVPVKAIYTTGVELNETSPVFIQAFIYALAAKMAYYTNQNATMTNMLAEQARFTLLRAVQTDSVQSTDPLPFHNTNRLNTAFSQIGGSSVGSLRPTSNLP